VGSSLHHAAAANQAAAAELLLLSSAKVDLPSTEDGGTPLHWSCGADAGEAALLLLEHGSSPHALDAHGNTPLEAAMVNGKISSPKLLELLAV
jgi:ankyrin repeat protein